MDTLRSFSSPTTSIYDPDVTSLVARSERNPGLAHRPRGVVDGFLSRRPACPTRMRFGYPTAAGLCATRSCPGETWPQRPGEAYVMIHPDMDRGILDALSF
jgi:hypothetical protein